MSWTDIFPFMDDGLVKRYQEEASPQEKDAIGRHFLVKEIFGRRPSNHVVATSLFWKPANLGQPGYPAPTRAIMENPAAHGLNSRFKSPWKYYVEPIFSTARQLAEARPDVTYRVYLASDLPFVLPHLLEAGCEVHLMESSSLLHNPGAMWRFLAMEEEGLVTMNDSDRASWLIHDIERTERLAEGPLAYWRCPYMWSTTGCKDLGSPGGYHPYDAAVMGCTKAMPIRLLAESFIWSCQKGHLRGECRVGDRTVPIPGSLWPEYGFDEFFLATAVHPRAAFEGVLTFVNWKNQQLNQWFALDIEYTTWANPASEIVSFARLICQTICRDRRNHAREKPSSYLAVLQSSLVLDPASYRRVNFRAG